MTPEDKMFLIQMGVIIAIPFGFVAMILADKLRSRYPMIIGVSTYGLTIILTCVIGTLAWGD